MAFAPGSCTASFGFQNDFQTTLSSAITDTDTAIPLSLLPTPTEGLLVIEPETANEEEIYFTSSGSGVVNCPSASAGRGVNSMAIAHNSGVVVKMLVSQAMLDAIKYGGALAVNAIKASRLATDAITLGYAEITSNFNDTTVNGDVDVTGLSITVTVPAGTRRMRLEARGQYMNTSASSGTGVHLMIKEGSSVLSESLVENNGAYAFPAVCSYVCTPSPGDHTYKVAIRQGAAGTMRLAAASSSPAYILATLI